MSNSLFIEIASYQEHKHTESCFGDTVLSKKLPEEQRIISVLSDGLGSGVKANILSSMTLFYYYICYMYIINSFPYATKTNNFII